MDLDNLKNNPEQIQLLINILQSLLPTHNSEESSKKKAPKSKTKNKTNNIRSKTRTLDVSDENKFLTMGVKDLHKEDTAIDKALSKFPPTPRNRSFKPISVTCRSCGKKESVNPVLVHDSADRYKCNKCSSSAG